MANELMTWLLHSTLALSAGILMVLAGRGVFRRRFGARVAYALWLLPPAAMVAVWLPAPLAATARVVVLEGLARAPEASTLGQAVSASSIPGLLMLGLVAWTVGALAMSGLIASRHRRFLSALGTVQRRGCRSYAAEGADGLPALVGLLRPRIVLPADFGRRYSPVERSLMIAHERAHLRRGDHWVNAVVAAVQCTFWFNPLVHLAAGRLRHDQELACDAVVMARRSGAARPYAEAMLKTRLAEHHTPLACHWGTTHPLKERIQMLKLPAVSPRRRFAGMLAVGCVMAVVGTAAWAAQPPSRVDVAPATPATATDPAARSLPTYRTMSPPEQPRGAAGTVLTGTVFLDVLVGADGAPLEVTVNRSSGHEALDAAASEAVEAWRFNPAIADGEPVAGRVIVPLQFATADEAEAAEVIDGALDTLTVRSAE